MLTKMVHNEIIWCGHHKKITKKQLSLRYLVINHRILFAQIIFFQKKY